MSSDKLSRVYVNGIPEGFKPFLLKLAIRDSLQQIDEPISVKFVEREDGTIERDSAEIKLNYETSAEVLLSSGLKIKHRDNLHLLDITASLKRSPPINCVNIQPVSNVGRKSRERRNRVDVEYWLPPKQRTESTKQKRDESFQQNQIELNRSDPIYDTVYEESTAAKNEDLTKAPETRNESDSNSCEAVQDAVHEESLVIHDKVSLKKGGDKGRKIIPDKPKVSQPATKALKHPLPYLEVTEFRPNPKVESDVIEFISKSDRGLEMFRDELRGVAEVTIIRKGRNTTIGFVPCVEDSNINLKYNQAHYELCCTSTMTRVFKTLCSKSRKYEPSSVVNLRQTLNLSEDDGMCKANVGRNRKVEVFVRWSPPQYSNLTLYGFIEDVNDVFVYIENYCNFVEDVLDLPHRHYRALNDCNIWAHVVENFQQNLDLKLEKSAAGGKVIIKGNRSHAGEAKDFINNTLMDLITKELPAMGKRLDFLRSLLSKRSDGSSTDTVDFMELIQSSFAKEKIRVSLQTQNDQVFLVYRKSEEFDKAVNALAESVEQRTIQIREGFQRIIHLSSWKLLKQKICTSSNNKVYVNETTSTIDIVGLKMFIDRSHKKIESFVKDHTIVTRLVEERKVAIQYLEKYFLLDKHQQKVKYEFDVENSVVKIHGKHRLVEKACAELQNTTKGLVLEERNICQPGMTKYFTSGRGRDQITAIAQTNRCIGEVDPENVEHVTGKIIRPELSMEGDGKFEVVVKQGDVTTSSCEAIVNSTHRFDLSSQVGKALLAKAGQTIAQECANNPISSTNNMRVTSGGNLCKYILHLATPNDTSQLEQVLFECLVEVERLGVKSVALPTVGAGGIGLSSSQAAKCLSSALDNLHLINLGSLQRVEVFVYQDEMLWDFQTELAVYTSTLASTKTPKLELEEKTISKPDLKKHFRNYRKLDRDIGDDDSQNNKDLITGTVDKDHSSATVERINNQLEVVVKHGDITTSSCEAIVNSTHRFNLSSHVGIALLAKAGQSIAQECANNPISSTNNMRVTSGGNLCRYILHLATPSDVDQMETILYECLVEVDRLGVKSVALPTVGAGGIGLSSTQAAKCLSSALDNLHLINLGSLQRVEVFVYQVEMLGDFERELASHISEGGKKQFPGSLNLGGVRILFCSTMKEDVDKAFQAVQKDIAEMSIEKSIDETTIGHLTDIELEELKKIGRSNDVIIEKASDSKITLRGYKTDVLECFNKATAIILKFEKILQRSQYVSWKYKNESGTQIKFPVQANYELESAYQINKKGKSNVKLAPQNVQYSVDFSKMEACEGSTTYKVERTILSPKEFPESWDDMNGEMFKKVELLPSCVEYQQVLQKYKTTLNVEPVKLERIQNPTLWDQFLSQRRKVEKRLNSKDVTRQLFHGTDPNTSESIIRHGFDRSYAGRHATFYGKGVYFARDASYSHTYSSKHTQKNKRMFLTDVITGVFCKGTEDDFVIPQQDDGTPYDCVVENTSNPTIFVVFRDASVYPAYMLTYN